MRAPDNTIGVAAPVSPYNPFPNVGPAAGPLLPAGPKTVPGAAALNPKKYVAPVKAAPKPAAKVGGGSTGAIAPVVQPGAPVAPAAPAWNENMDDTFLGQKSALQKAWEDYQTNQGRETEQYGTQYKANKLALDTQKDQDWASLQDEYASRGLMNSGLFGKATTDFNENYSTKNKNLEQAQTDFLANLSAAATGFKSDTDIQLEKARQDAINRRQASLGV